MPDLTAVTPLVLTWNEEPNIRRTLAALAWAETVVVLDSGSTDATERIAREFANVKWCVRPFDTHGTQWEYGIRGTGIQSSYVLALDADMVVNTKFVDEMHRDVVQKQLDAGELRFRMVLDGKALLGDIYPPQVRLFKTERVRVSQRGHTQVFTTEGSCHRFRNRIDHEDSKDCAHWLGAQMKYSELEAKRIRNQDVCGFKDRLRKWGVMPVVAGGLGYLSAGGPLAGAAAWRYAIERATFEAILALRLRRDSSAEGRSRCE